MGEPASGSCAGSLHGFRVRVYYEDTDAGGIVYHANYLKFAERARTEFLRLCGIGQDAMRTENGIGFAVRRCVVDFQAPARLDDVLEVRTRLHGVKGARVNAEQWLYKVMDNKVEHDWCVRLKLELASIGRYGRPVRLPERVRETFKMALVT
ncbi:MAG: acyl-CoA thioester hydrolase [Rhodospirillaceae bacterium]|nr:acyl-CoA thioester hydrolase [Rhodospirillaceae bacterium]